MAKMLIIYNIKPSFGSYRPLKSLLFINVHPYLNYMPYTEVKNVFIGCCLLYYDVMKLKKTVQAIARCTIHMCRDGSGYGWARVELG